MDPAQRLKRLQVKETVTAQVYRVSAVNGDGTVNLEFGSQVLLSIACQASYQPRTVGDVVLVLQGTWGWRVVGPVGPEAASAPAWGNITGKPQIVSLDFGNGPPPGSGWDTGKWHVKDGQVYVDTSSGAGGGGGTSPPKAPDNDTVASIGDAAYRSGGATGNPNPIQGAWHGSGYPAYSGAWFYGSKIKTSCDKGNVANITMTLVRSGQRHGSYGNVPPRLYLHNHEFQPNNTPALYNGFTAPGLQLGERRTFFLPADWVNALDSGSAKGIGCKAPKGSDYLIFGACGDLEVRFT